MKLLPTVLYETSFHLPNDCNEEELRRFLSEHSDTIPGLINSNVLMKSADSPIAGHTHYMVQYLFNSLEEVNKYINDESLSGPVRAAFTAKYGEVAKERKRYLNGEELVPKAA